MVGRAGVKTRLGRRERSRGKKQERRKRRTGGRVDRLQGTLVVAWYASSLLDPDARSRGFVGTRPAADSRRGGRPHCGPRGGKISGRPGVWGRWANGRVAYAPLPSPSPSPVLLAFCGVFAWSASGGLRGKAGCSRAICGPGGRRHGVAPQAARSGQFLRSCLLVFCFVCVLRSVLAVKGQSLRGHSGGSFIFIFSLRFGARLTSWRQGQGFPLLGDT